MSVEWYAVNEPYMTGWQRTDGPAAQASYRSPSGDIVGYEAYAKRRRKARTVESTATVAGEPTATLELPDTPADKPTPEVKKLGLATADELSQLAYYVLMIGTLILAYGSKQPAFAMTYTEAWALAVPIGNILQKSPVNKRYGNALKDSGDWAAIGYVLYAYLARVGNDVRAARESRTVQSGPVSPAAGGLSPLPHAAMSPVQSVQPAVQPTPVPNGRTEAPPDFARSLPFTPRPSNPQ